MAKNKIVPGHRFLPVISVTGIYSEFKCIHCGLIAKFDHDKNMTTDLLQKKLKDIDCDSHSKVTVTLVNVI